MKKLLAVIAAAAVALTLVGCGDVAGVGKATGTKWDKTYTVDATGELKNADATWRRYVKQIGTKEEIAEIKSTITIYKDYAKNDPAIFDVPDSSKSDGKAKAVVGFIVDYNANTENKDTSDFYVFGYRPTNKTIYFGPYSAIKIGKDVEMDTDNASLVDTTASAKAKMGDELWTDGKSYPASCVKTDADGNTVLEVSLKQKANGKYEFYLGTQKLGEWTGKNISTKKETKDMAIGGIAGYINVPKGAKVKVNYTTDPEDVTGSLLADEE